MHRLCWNSSGRRRVRCPQMKSASTRLRSHCMELRRGENDTERKIKEAALCICAAPNNKYTYITHTRAYRLHLYKAGGHKEGLVHHHMYTVENSIRQRRIGYLPTIWSLHGSSDWERITKRHDEVGERETLHSLYPIHRLSIYAHTGLCVYIYIYRL